MFLFYHGNQDAKSVSYYKGVLFEKLLQRYLGALGYDVELRKKRQSLEYDIEGKARLDGRGLVGEAKAHAASVPARDLTAFVGKLIPLKHASPSLLGIFLSASRLSPEAEDYHASLPEALIQVKILSGDKLLLDVAAQLNLPQPIVVQNAVREIGYFPLSTHLLIVEEGAHLLQISAMDGGITPAVFSVMRNDGQLISESSFLNDVRVRVPELQELIPGFPARNGGSEPATILSPRSPIPEGLILGNDWSDYRLPAPPEFFVGRRAFTDRVIKAILDKRSPRVIQIKSRSGVGKSSFIAFLAQQLRQTGATVALFDARNIKSVLDIWAIVQQLTSAQCQAADFGEMEKQLATLSEASNRKFVLLIDQFESSFSEPELYVGLEMLAIAIMRQRSEVSLVLARKNDLLTTFDDQKITLDRLNEISESFLLEDFSAPEAIELLTAISKNTDRPIPNHMKSYILEFAQGFPWLLKRTTAHAIALLRRGLNPAELAPASFRLDELFEEELADLDELERDYLVRMVSSLPSTYHQLAVEFDEDPLLPKILDRLTRERLLRLSGSTYDTYNDVFKEYLVYRRLPEFRPSFVYRLGQHAVMNAFWQLFEVRRVSTEQVGSILRKAPGTTFNLIRELRNVGLLDRDSSGYWIIPDAVLEAYERDRLGEYIRQQVGNNGLVADLVSHLQSIGPISREDLSQYLQKRFPFVEASQITWKKYSDHLINWLKLVDLIQQQGKVVAPSNVNRMEAMRRMANLRHRTKKMTHKVTPLAYLPGTWWRHIIAALEKIESSSGLSLTGKRQDALRELSNLHVATKEGKLVVKNAEDAIAMIRSIFEGTPYSSYWQRLKRGDRPSECIEEIFGITGLSPQTILWRAKILTDWGLKLGLISEADRKIATRRRPKANRQSIQKSSNELPLFSQGLLKPE
jgi:hypothetical protein